jgi:hypothetical protein
VSAAENIPTWIWPSWSIQKMTEKLIVKVRTMETRLNKRHKNM